ncbi:MAG TPA: glycosyltransferase family 87 protein [Opitutaceae bacterium]|nr:glycosyltransferase family 87 protein [Opitutaceae bacterium]
MASQFYLPGKGFTYLIMFGEKESPRYIPALRAINHYELENSGGYDAQYYAQIAMRPWLSNRALQAAVDSLPYRARRILFCWTAYGLAWGDPARALHIYAVQNIVCWLALAVLLLRWFPMESWENFVRWVGVLFSFGMCFSVRGSLVDGPSLLLIAGGVALAEAGRRWWSAALLGVAGLGKETNILAGATFAPPRFGDWRGWLRETGRWLLVVSPLVIWVVVLQIWLGRAGDAGARNFDWPFAAYFRKWQETIAELRSADPDVFTKWSVVMLVALTVQWLFFALRPRWDLPWWRIGAAYSVLMIFLGDAVWEGFPGAASRVLLPMALAFNVLVPRRHLGWFLALLAGNLTVLMASDTLRSPGRESFELEGPRELRMVAATGRVVEAVFDEHWYPPEKSWLEFWRWSNGSGKIVLRNPHPFTVVADISFGLRANDARRVNVKQDGKTLVHAALAESQQNEIVLENIRLEPGETSWLFETDAPAAFPVTDELRRIAFSLRNYKIKLRGKAEPLASPAPPAPAP